MIFASKTITEGTNVSYFTITSLDGVSAIMTLWNYRDDLFYKK